MPDAPSECTLDRPRDRRPTSTAWRPSPRRGTPALLAAAASCWFGAVAAAQGPPPAPVRVDEVRAEIVQEQRRVTGELRPVRRSLVSTRESGLVIEFPVTEGQVVAAGEVICRLDSRRLELILDELGAEVFLAEALLEERTAELQRASDDLAAIEALDRGGAVNPKELRDARFMVAIAHARRIQAERSAAVAEARVAFMRQRIEDMTLLAPFEGTVVTRRVELGQWMSEGSPVVELVSHGQLEAWLDVPQEFVAAVGEAIEAGKGVRIRVDATRAVLEPTQMRRIPSVDVRARTFPVVATLDQAVDALSPGMSVTGWVPTGQRVERLTLRRDAIMVGSTGAFVYVVRGGDDGQPAAVASAAIEVLFELGDRAAVSTRDLRAGDGVVIEGNERLFPGARVVPMRGDAPGVTAR